MDKVSMYPILIVFIITYLNILRPANCNSEGKNLLFSNATPLFSNDFVYCSAGSLIQHFTISWAKGAKYLSPLNEICFGCYTIPNVPSPKLQLTNLIHSTRSPTNCTNKYSTLTHHSACEFHGVINGYQLYQAGDIILNVRFFCTDETILQSSEVHGYSFGGNEGVSGIIKKCPFGKAMCGFRTRLHSENSMKNYFYPIISLEF